MKYFLILFILATLLVPLAQPELVLAQPPPAGSGVEIPSPIVCKDINCLVVQVIRGRSVEEAAALLRFMPQAAAKDVARVLKSATANAENNHNLSAKDLFVADAVANEGPTIKRWRPRAQGRAFPIHKPMTHITVVVENRED